MNAEELPMILFHGHRSDVRGLDLDAWSYPHLWLLQEAQAGNH